MAKKPAKVTADELTLVHTLTQEVRQKTEQLNALKDRLKDRLRQGARIDPEAPFVVHFTQSERISIPWESEANRWKEIALGYAAKLKVSKSALKKLEVTYPPVPTESLRISPKKD